MGLKNKQKTKISSESIKSRGGRCDQYPAISFRYLTTNNKYNFEYFKDDKEQENMLVSLSKRVADITAQTYEYWLGMRKYHGCELLDFWQFKTMKPYGIDLSSDDKVYVFRFGKQEYRICGVRFDKCPTLYIMGMDFDHSAYNH